MLIYFYFLSSWFWQNGKQVPTPSPRNENTQSSQSQLRNTQHIIHLPFYLPQLLFYVLIHYVNKLSHQVIKTPSDRIIKLCRHIVSYIACYGYYSMHTGYFQRPPRENIVFLRDKKSTSWCFKVIVIECVI